MSLTVAPGTTDLIARTSSKGNCAPSYTRWLPIALLKRDFGTLCRPAAASAASLLASPASFGPTVASALPARSESNAVLSAARLSSANVSGGFSGVHCFGLARTIEGVRE